MAYNMSDTEILEEFVARNALGFNIDSILEEQFTFIPSPRPCHSKAFIKRGKVHKLIASALNQKLTNEFCLKVRERVLAKGGELLLSEGKRFYKYIQERSNEM